MARRKTLEQTKNIFSSNNGSIRLFVQTGGSKPGPKFVANAISVSRLSEGRKVKNVLDPTGGFLRTWDIQEKEELPLSLLRRFLFRRRRD